MNLSTILHGLDTFEETLHKMRYANQRAELEMAFVKLCSPQLDTSLEALLRRLEALENGVPRVAAPVQEPAPVPAPAVEPPKQEPPSSPPAREPVAEEPPEQKADFPQEEPEAFQKAPSPPPVQESKPAPKSRQKVPAADVEALSAGAQRFRDWPEILQRIRGDTKSVAMAFSGSSAYVNGDYMLIDAPELAFAL